MLSDGLAESSSALVKHFAHRMLCCAVLVTLALTSHNQISHEERIQSTGNRYSDGLGFSGYLSSYSKRKLDSSTAEVFLLLRQDVFHERNNTLCSII